MYESKLNRDQQAVSDFFSASIPLFRIVDDERTRGLQEFANTIVTSIALFGQSELNYRQAERYSTIDVRGKDSLSAQKGKRYNDKGLKTLSMAYDSLKQIKEESSKFPKIDNLREPVLSFQKDFREELVNLDLKSSDVKKIDEAVQQCLSVVQSDGLDGIIKYLEVQTKKFEEIRKRPDRGSVENIPIWKVAAIVVAVGVWVWALFKCNWGGGCSLQEGLAYFIVFWIAALIARFC